MTFYISETIANCVLLNEYSELINYSDIFIENTKNQINDFCKNFCKKKKKKKKIFKKKKK